MNSLSDEFGRHEMVCYQGMFSLVSARMINETYKGVTEYLRYGIEWIVDDYVEDFSL
jgi:hypothetical protein